MGPLDVLGDRVLLEWDPPLRDADLPDMLAQARVVAVGDMVVDGPIQVGRRVLVAREMTRAWARPGSPLWAFGPSRCVVAVLGDA